MFEPPNPLWYILAVILVICALLPRPSHSANLFEMFEASKVAKVAAEKYKRDADEVDKYVDIAIEAAEARGIDPNILLAVIATESGFNPKAKNPNSSASGLTQVMAKLHRGLIALYGGNPFDPETSVNAGADLLQQHFDTSKGNVRKALNLYSGDSSGQYYNAVMKNHKWIKQARDYEDKNI